MQLRATERPKCGEEEQKKQRDSTWSQKPKQVARQGLKWFISSVLVRPATWRFLSVEVPEVWDKIALVGKQVSAWVSDFF